MNFLRIFYTLALVGCTCVPVIADDDKIKYTKDDPVTQEEIDSARNAITFEYLSDGWKEFLDKADVRTTVLNDLVDFGLPLPSQHNKPTCQHCTYGMIATLLTHRRDYATSPEEKLSQDLDEVFDAVPFNGQHNGKMGGGKMPVEFDATLRVINTLSIYLTQAFYLWKEN